MLLRATPTHTKNPSRVDCDKALKATITIEGMMRSDELFPFMSICGLIFGLFRGFDVVLSLLIVGYALL